MRYFCLILLCVLSTGVFAEVTSGNTKGSVTVVEYFDYNCPICRRFAPTMSALLQREPEVKLIQRVVPVLAPSSMVVDGLVLASIFQNKFDATDAAVLAIQAQETIPFPVLADVFRHLGLHLQTLTHDAMRPQIQQQLLDNVAKYHALNVHQIPVIQIYATDRPSQRLQFVGSQSLAKLEQAIQFIQSKQGEQ